MSRNELMGRVRTLLRGIDAVGQGDEEALPLNEQGEPIFALGSTLYAEIVKMGRAFEVHTTTAVAAVVARPTTAHLLGIWNGEPDSGRSLIIDRLWALLEAGTAAAGQFTILRALGQTRVASLATASLAMNTVNGNGGKDTKVINTTTALDAVTGVAGNWAVAPGQKSSGKPGAAATPGGFAECEVNGRIIVPPGRLFAIHVMADVVGSTFTVGIEWHEKKISLG